MGGKFFRMAEADPLSVSSLKMPEEYINYTVSWVNGSLWAKVEGTYPIYRSDVECQDQLLWVNNTGFTFPIDTLPMVYPTPPGTTNISLKMDDAELNWGNYTQIHPDALHYTAIGDWPMIYCTIDSVPDNFELKIHYEHPVTLINESYTFLYDLNISPYLSPRGSKSTAYFNISFETNYTNLHVKTTGIDETWKPANYTITRGNTVDTISLQIVSEYSKPLPGDLLIAFTADKSLEPTNSFFLGSSSPTEHGYAIVTVTVVALAIAGSVLFHNQKVGDDKRVRKQF